MRFARPRIPRTVSEPVAPPSIHPPVREQTLRTLQMLVSMGYSEVWVKSAEVDERTIELAGLDGWRICDADGERLKFTRRASITAQSPTAPARGRQDTYQRASIRTMSPTRLAPEPLPSPMAQWRRASETHATPPEEAARRRQQAHVEWGRRPSAEARLAVPEENRRPSAASTTPSVVVSPPAEDEGPGDYFAFVPVAPAEIDHFVPPEGSWLAQRQARPASPSSVYSLEDIAESNFEFDESDPFAAALLPPLPLPPPRAFGWPAALRPHTPQLNISFPRTPSTRTDTPPSERPTYQLNRVFSDPGADANPSFDLLPLLPPDWRCRDT